jgi:hypothetical protein
MSYQKQSTYSASASAVIIGLLPEHTMGQLNKVVLPVPSIVTIVIGIVEIVLKEELMSELAYLLSSDGSF